MSRCLAVSLVALFALAASAGLAHAGESGGAAAPPPATPQSADRAARAGDHEEAARQYRALVEQDATRYGAWFRLGGELLALGRHAEAAEAFANAATAPQLAPTARYNEGCARARAGDGDAALRALAGAVTAGFTDVALLESDADLASLRTSPGFGRVLEAAKSARSKLPERQFDFWVGSWEVRDPQGNVVGTNEITLRQKDHIVHERWVNAQGAGGESVNFYDPGRAKWRQLWVDDTGGVTEYEGEFRDGAMRFTGRTSLAGGATALVRATFSSEEGGGVRQLLEQSQDGGRTWTVTFDGRYRRKAAPTASDE